MRPRADHHAVTGPCHAFDSMKRRALLAQDLDRPVDLRISHAHLRVLDLHVRNVTGFELG